MSRDHIPCSQNMAVHFESMIAVIWVTVTDFSFNKTTYAEQMPFNLKIKDTWAI